MKKIILMAALAVASFQFASAQPQGGGDRRTPPTVEERVKMMDETVGLTDAQKVKVTEIFNAQDEKMKSAGEQADRRAMMEEADKQVAEILDAEQQEKLKAMMQNRQGGQGRPQR